jgi:hypothetical protein
MEGFNNQEKAELDFTGFPDLATPFVLRKPMVGGVGARLED